MTWGGRTIDEMMGGHVLYTVDSQQLNLPIDGHTGHPLPSAQPAANLP